MDIRFITFNLGKTQDMSAKEWYNEFINLSEWKELLYSNCTWVVCTQEDKKESQFLEAFLKALGDDKYYRIDKKAKNEEIRGEIDEKYHVHLGVFVPIKRVTKRDDVTSYLVRHSNKKMSVIVQYNKYLFVGSHFPFKPLPQNKLLVKMGLGYGLNLRIKALNTVLDVFKGSAIEHMFMLGDMNFRVLPKKKQIPTDQLKEIIDEENKKGDIYIHDITWPGEKPLIPPTCKMNVCKEEKRLCIPRDGCTNKEKVNIYGKIGEDAICFSTKRYPSLCDRILYVVKPSALPAISKIVDVKALEFGSILKSDHNAVYSHIKVNVRVYRKTRAS